MSETQGLRETSSPNRHPALYEFYDVQTLWTKESDLAYSSLHDTDEGNSSSTRASDIQSRYSRISRVRRSGSTLFYMFVALLALYGLLTLLRTLVPARLRSCNCDETVEEARANGCIYDSLAAAWLPPHCRSAVITEDFESVGPNEPDKWGNTWSYWADKNKT
ncbi:hypothetical protein F5X99DRAFT_407041 [Biscogniauxia marginata]|nr:hypothetical protein F5X99DRAFT_407041 [Biscogniauxia marginata]